jgi:hypothetical protein
MPTLKEFVEKLPPDLQQEVQDFIEFLLEKQAKKPRGKPRFDWAGALKDMKDQYTSVELQHEISKWRIGGQ